MEKTYKLAESSELYRKIDALKLAPSAREHALAKLTMAETLVGSAIWLATKLMQLGSATPTRDAAVSGKLKHQ